MAAGKIKYPAFFITPQSAESFEEVLLSTFHISSKVWVIPGAFCTIVQGEGSRIHKPKLVWIGERVILKTCRAWMIFSFVFG